MEETCPTVKVVSSAAPGGFVIINHSDFDPKVHTLFGARIALRGSTTPQALPGKKSTTKRVMPKTVVAAAVAASKPGTTAEQVKDRLDAAGVTYDSTLPVEELVKLLPA